MVRGPHRDKGALGMYPFGRESNFQRTTKKMETGTNNNKTLSALRLGEEKDLSTPTK